MRATKEELERRIEEALIMATWGSFDGGYHKMWVIDQMVRILTGCAPFTLANPNIGESQVVEESEEYKAFVEDYRGEWDEENEDWEYGDWDTGIAP